LLYLSQVISVLRKPEDDLSRREFLSWIAASVAVAGLTGCAAAPPEKIVPYVRQPEELLPGKPLFFATAIDTPGYGIGVLVESHEGRPTKVEGNPDHPASLGATDIFTQASLLTLYDPDRAQTVTKAGQISTWDAFITELRPKLDAFQTNGQGLRILTETVTSPTMAGLLRQFLAKYPGAQWHQYEPINRDNVRAGARLAFGRYVDTQYRFDDADVILSLDSDFLTWQPGNLHYVREFAGRRKVLPGEANMNRLYVVESTPTITGAMADHRFPMRSSDIYSVASALVESQGPFIGELQKSRGRSIVIAGEGQPPEVHAMVHTINERLGNVGKTVFYTEPVEANAVEQTQSLKELVADMTANRVEALVSLGGNPVYTAPADLEFSANLAKVPLRAHQSLYYDETATMSHWHIPESHCFERWGDVRAYDGTTSIVQPLINPLYQSRSAYELLSALLGDPSRSGYEIVRDRSEKEHAGADFASFWTRSVQQGFLPSPSGRGQGEGHKFAQTLRPSPVPSGPPSPSGKGLEIVFRPDPCVFDGRWANNAWLQELPKPITKLVWDNAALMSAATAEGLGVGNEDVIEIKHEGRAIDAPVWIVPGHADLSITLPLGYGRLRAGRVGNQKGFNAYILRTSMSPWFVMNAEIRKTGRRYPLVTTQKHHEIEGRHMARYATANEYSKNPRFASNEVKVPAQDDTLYPRFADIDYSWGMAVDLSACIGCNACVVACQAENNVPVVGKSEAANSREMHWLRIDTYFSGDPKSPEVLFEPMLCQHCENAPCELVCPVEATSHSAEGINEMTYNRCVGTRYCSNNCPYKVRRFNFYQYAEWDIPQFKLLYNPNVTVRSRGVMEKCTYCIQRVNRARIQAEIEDRLIRDGEVVTACQAVCPAKAITFGNTKDPSSAVSKAKAQPRNYGVLAELNTRPRTTYLAKLTNPNPELL
jgi:molybdopterin-containing oxidoreductase family iron-sulfur binding subunit